MYLGLRSFFAGVKFSAQFEVAYLDTKKTSVSRCELTRNQAPLP